MRADETRRMAEQTEDFATPGLWGKDDVESQYLAGDDVFGSVCHKLG